MRRNRCGRNVDVYIDMTDHTCPICQTPTFRPLFEARDLQHGLGGGFTVVQCSTCELVSYEPLPDETTLAGFYPADYYAHGDPEAVADPPAGSFRRLVDDLHLGIRRNPFLAVMLSPLLWYKEVYSYARYLRPIPRDNRPAGAPVPHPPVPHSRGRLLDVGCGDGGFLLKARRMGFECHGLEPGGRGAPGLERAGIPVATCPLDRFEGHDNAFDVITLNHVFEHLLDPVGALRKIQTLLAPGGRVLIRMPRTDHFLFRRCHLHWFQLDIPRHVYLYDASNFNALAENCGFVIDSVRSEAVPLHYQLALKSALLRRSFGQSHWIDSRPISMALLPVCALIRIMGQTDAMAIWLRSREGDR